MAAPAASRLDAAFPELHHALMGSTPPSSPRPAGGRPLAAALAALLLAAPHPARSATAADSARVRAWQTGALRPDRLRHVSLSFAAGMGVGIATDSPGTAAGVSLALGVAKELADRRGTGFDPGDLAADALGAVLAAWATAALRR